MGAVGWGLVADRFGTIFLCSHRMRIFVITGRRRTLLLTTGLITVGSFFSASAANYEMYLLFRFVVGVGLAGHGLWRARECVFEW